MSDSLIREARYKLVKRANEDEAHPLLILRARRFLADYPDDAHVWFLLGHALVELAHYQEAEAALTKALELCGPRSRLWVYRTLGSLFEFSGDRDQAAAWYQRMIDDYPNDTVGYIDLGSLRARQGRMREAEDVHRAGTRCEVGNVDEAYMNLGLVLRCQLRFAEAEQCFQEVLRLDPNDPQADAMIRDVRGCLAELHQLEHPPTG